MCHPEHSYRLEPYNRGVVTFGGDPEAKKTTKRVNLNFYHIHVSKFAQKIIFFTKQNNHQATPDR